MADLRAAEQHLLARKHREDRDFGGRIILHSLSFTGISALSNADRSFFVVSDFQINTDFPGSLDDRYRPPVDVAFARILGLFASLRQNLKPDSPGKDGKIQRVVRTISEL